MIASLPECLRKASANNSAAEDSVSAQSPFSLFLSRFDRDHSTSRHRVRQAYVEGQSTDQQSQALTTPTSGTVWTSALRHGDASNSLTLAAHSHRSMSSPSARASTIGHRVLATCCGVLLSMSVPPSACLLAAEAPRTLSASEATERNPSTTPTPAPAPELQAPSAPGDRAVTILGTDPASPPQPSTPTPAPAEDGSPGSVEPTPPPRAVPPDPRAPRGKLLDRNGLPLAVDRTAVTSRDRKILARYGIDIYEACEEERDRCYPLGGSTFHLLGDIRMPIRWNHARTTFLERELQERLSGNVVTQNPAEASIFLVDDLSTPAQTPVPTRDVKLSIDARLQLVVADLLTAFMTRRKLQKAAVVVLDPNTFEVLAMVSYPFPEFIGKELRKLNRSNDAFYDRARHVYYPPGSTFKLVTSMAAMRADVGLQEQKYSCQKLEDKRVGCILPSGEVIRDDELDLTPHGDENLEAGLFNSCNAYFAQLLTQGLPIPSLMETADLYGIELARPATEEEIRKALPQTSFGQGEVLATPMEMAEVAATIANGGWLYPLSYIAESDPGYEASAGVQVVTEEQAALLGRAMRNVVLHGTAKEIRKKTTIAVAGKTGTAEVERGPSHGWFVGYAPYQVTPREDGSLPRQIAFAVLVENGGYGGRTAAPLAARIVNAAMKLGILDTPAPPVKPSKHK